MQHGEAGKRIQNTSCCSMCDAEELMRLSFNPDLAKSRWRTCVSFWEWHQNLNLYLFIFLGNTLATCTQMCFQKNLFEDNPGFACSVHATDVDGGWRNCLWGNTAWLLNSWFSPVALLQRGKLFLFFFSLMCVIRPLWEKSCCSAFSTSVSSGRFSIYPPLKKKKTYIYLCVCGVFDFWLLTVIFRS